MIKAFIKHVLGADSDTLGLFGDTSAYYGTVEQQGRLTLHLHLLLWIRGGLTPDEARAKIMDPNSPFLQELVKYLESTYNEDFLTGSKADVESVIITAEAQPEYIRPMQTMPEPPPEPCQKRCEACESCKSVKSWWQRFEKTVDDIIFRTHVHTCSSTRNKDDNIWGKCKARFPRPTFDQSEVDLSTGHLNIKKNESSINGFCAPLTYLFRCNTDVTSLRSGTAIKGVLLYVTKYVTKPSLKTFVAFDTVRSIFQK
ncbi:hypothetical protein BDZ94DRAFT_1330870, partial [Collybia nuda]